MEVCSNETIKDSIACSVWMVLAAASLAPIAAKASCPTVPVSCPGGVLRQCEGAQQGTIASYDADCLNCATKVPHSASYSGYGQTNACHFSSNLSDRTWATIMKPPTKLLGSLLILILVFGISFVVL